MHLIYDFETLGQNTQTCPVIDISWIAFDWSNFTSDMPYTPKELFNMATKVKLNVEDQIKNYGFKAEKSTIEFWMKQDKSVRDMIKPRADDVKLSDFMETFIHSVSKKNIDIHWTRSNTFDPIILDRIARITGNLDRLNDALKFWKVRDTRTFIDAKTDFNTKMNSFNPLKYPDRFVLDKHNSIHDIILDILRLQTLVRLDNNLEILS